MSSISQEFDREKMNLFFDAIESNDLGMGSVSIYQGDKEVYKRSLGFENLEPSIKASPDTRYRIGSITKSIMSAIIVQMIDEEKLELDTKLSKFYPMFENSDQITIEHLLRHRSGLFNFTDDPSYPTYEESPQTREAMLEKMLSNGNNFSPNMEQQYSNTGYVLLSYIAEKVDGKPFAKILADRIARPHKLKNTYLGGSIGSKENEAHSYHFQSKRKRLTCQYLWELVASCRHPVISTNFITRYSWEKL
jgi:CubicO group peptidase (beta-lactamase class C family)